MQRFAKPPFEIMLACEHSSDVAALVKEIMSREPLVTPRKLEQLTALIISECMRRCGLMTTTAFSELQQKIGQAEKNQYYLFKVLRAHILPLTNVAFNKSGSRRELLHVVACPLYVIYLSIVLFSLSLPLF